MRNYKIKGVHLSVTPTKRGKLISNLAENDYFYFGPKKFKVLEFLMFLKKTLKYNYSFLHFEFANDIKPFLLIRILSIIFKFKVVYDGHTVIISKNEIGKIKFFIYKKLLKNQHLIAHNLFHSQYLSNISKKVIVLHTPISLNFNPNVSNTYYYDFAVLTSSYSDFPIEVVNYLSLNGYKIYLSGNVPISLVLNSNIFAPGYVNNDIYHEYVSKSKNILALSLRNECLSLTAREALMLNKPVIVVKYEINELFFRDNVYYLDLDKFGNDTEYKKSFFQTNFQNKIDPFVFKSQYENLINSEIYEYRSKFN
jgi:hypothetical protein